LLVFKSRSNRKDIVRKTKRTLDCRLDWTKEVAGKNICRTGQTKIRGGLGAAQQLGLNIRSVKNTRKRSRKKEGLGARLRKGVKVASEADNKETKEGDEQFFEKR